MFGVIKDPSAAPPLYRETSLNPKSSARIKIILGLVSLIVFESGPFCQFEDPTDKTGFVIFKIWGSAQTTIFTLLFQITNDNTRKNVRVLNNRFIFYLMTIKEFIQVLLAQNIHNWLQSVLDTLLELLLHRRLHQQGILVHTLHNQYILLD